MVFLPKKFVVALAAASLLSLAPVLSFPALAAAQSSTGKVRLVPASAKKAAAKPAKAKRKVKAAAKRTAVKRASAKRRTAKAHRRVVRRAGLRPSQATLAGLRQTEDPLQLGSSVAYAVDQDTGEELVVKNADVQLPIASVTKLMTALVVAESDLDLDHKVRITRGDYVRSTASSKLRSGMVLTREALLKAALMSSDNRAAHALARSYPGGVAKFVDEMNRRAEALGMTDSRFFDPTGLDNRNQSTARDLGKLVAAVYEYQEIRQASTAPAAKIRAGRRTLSLRTTNRLIGDPSWRIGIQKTGFTTAAGRCMVVQSDVEGRRLVMVVLDSPNNSQRALDMRTMRAFVEAETAFREDFKDTVPYELF